MSESAKINIFLVLLGAFFVWFIFLAPHAFEWETEAEINVFPSADSSKSYRLSAYADATEYNRGWFHLRNEFEVRNAQWPNGGELYFDECHVIDSETATCTDDNGERWKVDVHSFEDRPEEDYPGDG